MHTLCTSVSFASVPANSITSHFHPCSYFYFVLDITSYFSRWSYSLEGQQSHSFIVTVKSRPPPRTHILTANFRVPDSLRDAASRLQRSHQVSGLDLLPCWYIRRAHPHLLLSRPLPSLSFSPLDQDKQHFLLVSSCKDGIPMVSPYSCICCSKLSELMSSILCEAPRWCNSESRTTRASDDSEKRLLAGLHNCSAGLCQSRLCDLD